jgi:DNA-binding NarL/FixJ family response regulator
MLVEQSVVCPVLIARDAPLSAGYHALDRARAAHGGTLLVSGEAGIGKSRFVRAVAERARTLGFLTLQGACFETDRAHPYAPLLDLVRTSAATTSPSLAAHYFEGASTELVALFPELRSIFPDAPARQALDPEEDRRRLFHAFTEAIHTVGGVQPALLVIEDVHWSDDATLDLLLHLARGITSQRISLVLTFRSDEIGPRLRRLLSDFDRARCASEVELRPLDVPDVSTMMQSIFGPQVAFGTPFVGALHGLTEGNPFFIEEMLKSLLEAGDLVRQDGAWRARAFELVRVPRTATEAVARRLSALSPKAREVASIAAVAGRRFDFELLQTLTQHDEAQLLELVRELVDAQLVVEESSDRFAFRHALTREAMRARLLARERVALHRAIATALEQVYDDSTHDGDDALSYHWYEAGEWESARRYALRAAERALALSAPREAQQHFDRAVTATVHAGLRPDAALLTGRGRAHETLGSFGQANDDFSAALLAAREAGDHRSEWMALHALGMLWAARDYERAGGYRRDALQVARSIRDPSLIARSLNRIGNWFSNRENPHAGIPHHDEALAIFEAADDQRGVAETVDLIAMAHHIAGDESEAARAYERSIDLFTALDDRRALTNALSVLPACGPSHHVSAGPVATSVHTAELLASERALRVAADIGWRAGEAFSRYLLADCLAWRGEYARALRIARESLAIAQELDHLEWQCGARRVLGVIALDLFDSANAIEQLAAAHDIARRLGSATWIRWTGAPVAIALARASRPDEAAATLDGVDEIVPITASDESARANRTLGARYIAIARAEIAMARGDAAEVMKTLSDADAKGTPRTALLRGQALAALERWDEATASLALARIDARKQHARTLLWRIDAAEGAIHLAARRRLEARRFFDSARSIAAEIVEALDEPALVASFRAGVDRLAPPPPVRTTRQAAKATFGGLTRRERDTAGLVAQGKPNRAIARLLGIGERTVEGYVASALAKLDFTSRTQLAVWAAEQGLARDDAGTGRPRR